MIEGIEEAIDTANRIIAEWEAKYRQAWLDRLRTSNEELKATYHGVMKNANLNKQLVMFYRDGLEYALKLIRQDNVS